eukprot:TRINITY_DN1257_c0_g1_i9.p1 TRINITY_DN1257_c0_g1~~TRINITY_DN1257_c0_g1_i9.p1  ORF type:complete len:253 (-),score=45.69 TRINITY_DN1257_c0_g1_i9:496-1254(-)
MCIRDRCSSGDQDLIATFSFEDMGLSMLQEDMEMGRYNNSHLGSTPWAQGTISPRSQLIAELLANTPKSQAIPNPHPNPHPVVDKRPKQEQPQVPYKVVLQPQTSPHHNNSTLITTCRPNNNEQVMEVEPVVAEVTAICNPVAEEHLNPRLRVVSQDKKCIGNPNQVNQTQMLWHKYGEKIVRNRKAVGSSPQLQRAYYKCFKRECSARLTVDLDMDTREVVKTSSSGSHHHVFEIATDDLESPMSAKSANP